MRVPRAAVTRHRSRQILLGAGMAAAFLYPTLTRAEDGLQRFQKLLPELRAEMKKDGGGSFDFKKGSAIGASGFELDDVTIVVPPDKDKKDGKPSTATIKKILVEDLDFDRLNDMSKKDTAPYFAKITVQGLGVEGGMQEQMKGLGLPATTLDMTIDYRYEEDRKVLTLNKFEVQLPGLASIGLTMILDGVPPPGPDTAKQAEDTTTLRTATLTLDDHSLLAKTLPIAAAITGMEVDAGIGMLRETLGGMLAGQSDASVNNADALVSYALDWKAPKGPLVVRLTPAANAKFAELKKVDSPDAAQKILGLAVTYSGTRAGVALASASGAPSSGPGATASGSGGAGLCAKDGRVFVRDKDEGTLTAGTVIEATGGGRCIVRLEGAAKGDDTVAALGDLRKWSVDGPGEALAACEKGKSVIALSDGVWTPGKIKSAKGGKCEVKLEGQDDADELPLSSIRVATDG
jgi:hypothetical protein